MPIDPNLLRRLQRAAKALDAAATEQENAFLAAMQRSQAKMFERVAELLSEAPVDEAMRKKLSWYAQNLFAQDERIAEIFREDYMKGARQYVRRYDTLLKLNEDLNLLAAGEDATISGFSKIPKELVQAIQKRDLSFFDFLGDKAVKELDNTLLDQLLTATSRESLLGALRGKITGTYKWGDRQGLYEWHAGTYARTAHVRFSRQVDAYQAEKYGVEQFVYIGPLDSVTRAFCAPKVGKVFTRDEIDGMSNGQTADVFTDGGGWNCRHKWIGVPAAVAEALKKKKTEAK